MTASYGETVDERENEAVSAEVADRNETTLRPRGEKRRSAILLTARSLFSARGFNSVSLADIAREVGITQAGVLHYFPTKAKLLLAVLQQREEENLASRLAMEASGMSRLDSYVGLLAENDAHPELVQLFVILSAEAASKSHPGHEWFRDRHENAVEFLRGPLRELIDMDLLPDGVDDLVLTRWILALSQGLGAQWVFDPSSFDRAGHVALFIDLLKPFLRKPAGDDASSSAT